MISKKKLWLKFSLFFITLIIVPILIFESIMISKNAGSFYETIKLNTALGKNISEFSLTELLSAIDGQIKKGDVILNYKVAEDDSNRIIPVKGNKRIEIPRIEIPLNKFAKKSFNQGNNHDK